MSTAYLHALDPSGNLVPLTCDADGKLSVDMAAVSLGAVEITNDSGNPIPVAVTGRLASATITRPADTTAYAAKDVVSTGAGALLTFANVVATAAGSGTIVKARLMTDQSTNTAQYRLHLFHTAPTAIADNAPYTMLYANAANRVGMIDFPPCATEGTGSTAAASMRPSSDGNSLPPNLAFKCATGSTSLHGILETLGVFTPASEQNYFIELEME